jgi:regulator of CtrA degradation
MSRGAPATEFFGRTYGEAVNLLVEARDYLAHREPVDRGRLMPGDRLHLSCEAMRLTARVTQIMAWLLAQRAVHDGEITQDKALEGQAALADIAVCMTSEPGAIERLPNRLAGLLDRSQRLYIRVARLDELARRQLE